MDPGLRRDDVKRRFWTSNDSISFDFTDHIGRRKEDAMCAAFEPQIVAFCCKYCAYAAGDLAGSMRLSYPPNVKVVQIPCTGRVDILHLLRAVEAGADAVYVAG
jgi:F420-non-reducing hydrogenase iron-sulfur subunit